MSELFKNLKSIFVVDEGSKVTTPREDKPPTEQKSKTEVPRKTALEVEIGEGEVNAKFTNILLKAIEANNQQGFDYLEFKKSLQNLQKMGMDEQTIYQSAYATAQTMGATPKALIDSAEHYLQVLGKEEEKFGLALSKQREKQIDGRHREMQTLQEGIAKKKAKIKELQEQVTADENRLTKIADSIKEAAEKVESTNQDFIASYRNLVTQIKQDVTNIKEFLK